MAKKTWVDKSLCIGCMACVSVDNTNTLFCDSDGLAQANENDVALEECQMVCPTGAIIINKEKK